MKSYLLSKRIKQNDTTDKRTILLTLITYIYYFKAIVFILNKNCLLGIVQWTKKKMKEDGRRFIYIKIQSYFKCSHNQDMLFHHIIHQ